MVDMDHHTVTVDIGDFEMETFVKSGRRNRRWQGGRNSGRFWVLTGPHAVETNKAHDPVHVGSLGVNGVVVQTEYLSDLIEEFWLSTLSKPQPFGWGAEGLTFCRVRHIRLP